MKLLIVESPNKKQTISKYLGSGWRVEASIGHICDLPLKELGVSVPEYEPKYELTERGQQTIQRLKGIAKGAESVWLATDPDREGEAIAAHLAQYLKAAASTFYRVVFHEITEKAVQAAIKEPREIDQNLFNAQQARRVIDRLVGYQVSPCLNQITGQKLSAGRVQSVALRLLVERERAIQAFKATEHFGVRLHFESEGIKWFANWNTEPFVNEENPYVMDRTIAEEASQIKIVSVRAIEKKLSVRKAPPPFITTTLQKAASLQFGFTASTTMQLAQILFEKGLITYHRTDNPNLSEDAIKIVQTELQKLGLGDHIANPANSWKAKAGAQEAHEAIRPTNLALIHTMLDEKAQQLYELIRLRTLACQVAAAKLETTTVVLEAAGTPNLIKDKIPSFTAKWVQTIYPGWCTLMKEDLAEEKIDEECQTALPVLKEKSKLHAIEGEALTLKTQAPKRYSEAALITRLEKEGIGRPSTYASILSNIQNRGYIKAKGKCFEISPAAEKIYDVLVGKFQFMEIDYTRAMETALDEIAQGRQDYLTVVKGAGDALQQGLHDLLLKSADGRVCPECGAVMRKINGKKGTFWGCTRYQEGCKGTLKDAD